MRIRKLAITAFVICIGAMPSEVHAGDSIGGSTTSSAGVNGNQIMAGIQFGATPGSSGATEDCEWSLAIPHDSHTGNQSMVEKVSGGTSYRLLNTHALIARRQQHSIGFRKCPLHNLHNKQHPWCTTTFPHHGETLHHPLSAVS